ncbi:FKBP-type peptidyl-prolyl cis-trans isomerase [Alkaliflexus imshenetskii]|uniref:FKBP-type peptidyl-prolyl cis-trans isomerase n=1 Tax=Alkaliflexus imshenetskii TaxID=286730 RepID=UPI00047C3DCD|nr:FKBP-type peptidyl-prolyl cis-trans isomerase [Alkaliflexus imshenetskii]
MMLSLKNTISRLLFVSAAALFFVTVGCNDNRNFIDYRELERLEKELLQEFLDINLAEWTALATDTIDKRNESGLIYFEMLKGTGDSVRTGKQVSIRYTFYEIGRDDEDKPKLFFSSSNITSMAPLTYIAGNTSAVFAGLDQGIRYMRHFGKSRLIIPSSIGTGQYITLVADVEVTAIELD